MKLLTKNSDYAVRALVYLAKHNDRYVPSSEIASSETIPLHFLRRILQKLTKAGLVSSREGIAGGVRLAQHPSKIKVGEVIRIFQGRIQLSECMFRKRLCSNRARCVLRKKIKQIEKSVIRQFERLTIASLLNEEE